MIILKKRMAKAFLSLLLVFALIVANAAYILPEITVKASAETVNSDQTANEVEAAEAQKGAEKVRDKEALIKSENVIVSKEGKPIGIKVNKDGRYNISAKEMGVLFGDNYRFSSSEQSVKEAKEAKVQTDKENIQKKFGLSEERIDKGEKYHGSSDLLISELCNFDMSVQFLNISDDIKKDIIYLISSGYTSSQAFAAKGAATVLGLSIEDISQAKENEIESKSQNDDEFKTRSEISEEENEDYLKLSIKMGLPYGVVESYMKSNRSSCEEVQSQFESIMRSYYPAKEIENNEINSNGLPSSSTEAVESGDNTENSLSINTENIEALNSSDVVEYFPEKITEKPYTYESDGDLSVNLNNGRYSYSETDLSIPGVNGLDLNIKRMYDSSDAESARKLSFIIPENANSGYTLGVGFQPYLVQRDSTGNAATDEYGNIVTSPITDTSEYTFDESYIWTELQNYVNPGSPYNESLALINPCYLIQMKAKYYGRAVAIKEALSSNRYWLSARRGGAYVSIVLKPVIIGFNPNFSNSFFNYTDSNNYSLNQYGLGQGWRLGFSGIETYTSGLYGNIQDPMTTKQCLITSDGRKYQIKFTSDDDDSNLVDYKLNDMRLENTGNNYTGASYTLFHKDGKKEYFDANGRNIAIVDRYGNAITLGYTVSNNVVLAINITDSVGNNVIYSNSNITTPGSIDDIDYNVKWTLTLNGQLIREYYADNTDGVQQLLLVSNENNEHITYYSQSNRYKFNSFTASPSTNDSYINIIELYMVGYPNGLYKSFNCPYSKAKERLGYAGYEEYARIANAKTYTYNENMQELYVLNRNYEYGDFSGMNTYTWNQNGDYGTYSTKQTERSGKLVPQGGFCLWQEQETVYKFEFETQHKLSESLYTYPTIQDSQVTSFSDWNSLVTAPTFVKSLAKKSEYTYDDNDLPITAKITNYDPGSTTAGMIENHAYTYDKKGNVLTHTKPNNQTVTNTYDSNYSLLLTQSYNKDADTAILSENVLTTDGKNIASSTVKENSVLKAKTEYTYGANGNRTGEKKYTDATNYVESQYVYGYNAQVTESKTLGVRDLDGNLISGSPTFSAGTVVSKASYNTRGWPTSKTDAAGNATAISYDSTGRITGVTNPDGSSVSYSYDVINNTVTVTDELGGIIRYTYSKWGAPVEVYDVTGGQALSSKRYDALKRLISETAYSSSGNNKTTYYYYDSQNRLIEKGVKNDGGTLLSQETYAYLDGTGKTTKTIVGDANAPSVVTTQYKNNMGFVTATGRILNGVEYQDTYGYDYVGNKKTERSAYTASIGGAVTNSYIYDFAGRVLSVTDALGHVSQKSYDWLGNTLSETDYSQNVTLYTYDALARLLQKQQPFSSNSGTTYYTFERYSYDLNGNAATKKISNSEPGAALTFAQTDYAYNNRNNLVKVTAYNGQSANYTQYYYDAKGGKLRMYTGLSSPLTISGLDSVSGADADYSVTKYTYDRFGRLLTTTDPLNQTETYTYDLNGTVLTKTDRNGRATTYTYDALGRPTNSNVDTGDASLTSSYTLTGQKRSESSTASSATYTYDALGRVTQESAGQAVKTYGYNIGGSRTSFTLTANGAQQFNTSYAYDALNRLTGVTDGTVTAAYGYDTNGNRSYMQYNNGLREEYAYNLANRVTSVTNKNGQTVLSQYTYTYTLDGNQLTKTDNTGKVTAYAYDGLGRLECERLSGTALPQSYSYSYDDRGNRSTLTAAGTDSYTTAYTYDVNNRLINEIKALSGSTVSTNYYYDPNGNQTAKATETLSDASGNESNTLINGVAGGETRRYNGFNQLVAVDADGISASYAYAPSGLRISKTVNGIQTAFVLDGGNAALELSGGAVTAKYIWGANLISSAIGSNTNYYLYNGHGDVAHLANSSGAVTKTYEYDAFGNEKDASEPDVNPFRYCGEYYDLETKTYYLRARNYDPTIGRFLSEDPAQSGLNWYTYCYNNPIFFFDPSGLEQIVVSGGAYDASDDNPYQYTFVDSSLLQISKMSGGATLLIADAGWSDDQRSKIVQAAADRGINLVWFKNMGEFSNYINYGGIDGTGNRANDLITSFYVFTHGGDYGEGNYALYFGMNSDRHYQLSWFTDKISNIYGSAFSSNAVSYFYSCRTGNTFNNGNFAQLWANTTGGATYAFSGLYGKTDYTYIYGDKWSQFFYGKGIYEYLTEEYINFRNNRGPLDLMPGEAWCLPVGTSFSSMCYYAPNYKPGTW